MAEAAKAAVVGLTCDLNFFLRRAAEPLHGVPMTPKLRKNTRQRKDCLGGAGAAAGGGPMVRYEVDPHQIYGWKAAHRRRGPCFDPGVARGQRSHQDRRRRSFYAKIGQLTVEQDLSNPEI
jgi:hypothetical protein